MINRSTSLVKEINLNNLRITLKHERIASKPQLAELTGLSVVTINSLINILAENGEISEDVILPSSGGRPAAAYRFNSNFSLALVIYMHEQNGKDTSFFCVVNLYGEIIERIEQPLSEVNLNCFDPLIEKLLLKYTNIKVICFGMPGEEVDGRLLLIDYKELREQYFSSYIQNKFHLPVIVENDINAAIVGYCTSHNIPVNQCVIGLYFPSKYPPGAGIYLNGNLYKGRNGMAGEIKYLPFGIDWENFNYDSETMKEIMIKTVLSFHCMYNPDIIVLYGDGVNQSIIAEIKNRCKSEIENIMLPEIILSDGLNADFELGIKQLALRILEPTFQMHK